MSIISLLLYFLLARARRRDCCGVVDGGFVQEVEASELKMRLDEALSVHRQAAARENEQQGYWQVFTHAGACSSTICVDPVFRESPPGAFFLLRLCIMYAKYLHLYIISRCYLKALNNGET